MQKRKERSWYLPPYGIRETEEWKAAVNEVAAFLGEPEPYRTVSYYYDPNSDMFIFNDGQRVTSLQFYDKMASYNPNLNTIVRYGDRY